MRHAGRSSAAPHAGPAPIPAAPRIRAAIDTGDIPRACRLLENEVRRTPSDVRPRVQLASLKEAIGDREGAALELTRALNAAPTNAEVAHRLAALLATGRLAEDASLDASGLVAALQFRTVDRDLVGAAAVQFLKQDGTLRQALAKAERDGSDEAARAILARRSAPLLRDALLLAVLQQCTITSLELERLLTAIRRVILLSLSAERLAEADLARFATALAAQCRSNEYVFAETPDETERLGAIRARAEQAVGGDMPAGAHLLLYALYRDPLSALPADVTAGDIAAVMPPPLSRFLSDVVAEAREIRERSISIPRLGDFIGETTQKVKAQYEAHPYPRWRGTALFPNGQYVQHLQTFFSNTELAFARTPFDVLVAGCGTGLQAISAALDYGRLARVMGLDISAASLGYAGLMAKRMQADNLALVLGDIGSVRSFTPPWSGRFSVIECCGVLHHTADPFAAWRDLLDCLAPGGIMLVGLYSAIARRELEILRREPIYPGAGCDDDALRRYRQALLARGSDAPGASYLRSRDIFTTSGFRDFFLHVSEKPTTLADIQRFLDANGLAFRGFVNVPFGALRQRFPDEAWPGRLERWAALEAERPQLFIGMYQFWVKRRVT
jgi:SAM-dependent methyltransferase